MASLYQIAVLMLGVFPNVSGNRDLHDNIVINYENFSCAGWLCENEPLPEDVPGSLFLKNMGCFCDGACGFFDDCCSDVENLTVKSIPKSLRTYIDCTYQCLVSTDTPYYAVVRCPRDYPNNEVSELCSTTNTTDRFLQIPATGKTTGLMYRNIFCAQCHQEEAQLWLFYVKCVHFRPYDIETITTNISDLLPRENCGPRILRPPNVTDFRPCFTSVIASCPPDTSPGVREQCEHTGQQLVNTDEGVFKNAWCAVCNNQTSLNCYGNGQYMVCDDLVSVHGFYTMSLLFDITAGRGSKTVTHFTESEQDEFETGGLCSSGEIYDPFKDICRQLGCAEGFVYEDGHCEVQHVVTANGSVFTENGTLNNCPRITLNETEFVILKDGRLMQTLSRVIRDLGDFVIEGANAIICAANHSNIVRPFIVVSVPKFSTLEGIISGTGMIISLVALLLTIIVYIAFKPLRNLPGCNIMCLSIALFAAEITMLIAPVTEDHPIICKIFGTSMHYLFLVAFMWMNVIAVDAWSTFSKGIRCVRKAQSLKLRFMIYSLLAWLGPSVPVVTAILMDVILPSSEYAPRYGHDVCWINSELAVLIFFAAPLAFVIFVNTVLFIITSVAICSVKKASARQLGREDKREFLIYIKLFVVMGLTWILGFLSAFVPHPATIYLYIIVNSLQGLFIGISFVCTRKVFDLFRKKFRGSQSESSGTNNPHFFSLTSRM